MSNFYNKNYFSRYKDKSFIKNLYLSFVDKREPVFSFLKKKKEKNSKLLEIGCGDGRFLQYAQKHFVCTGIDISDYGVKEAKKKADKSVIMNLSAYNLDKFNDNQFDIVACFDVIEHLLDIENVFKEVFRVLKKDGIFVVSSQNGDCISKSLKWEEWFGFKDKTHLWFFSPKEWEYLLNRNGFVPMKYFYNGFMDPPYFKFVPGIVQLVLFKYLTQGISFFGFPIPKKFGELFFLVCIKNPGWNTDYYKEQLELLNRK